MPRYAETELTKDQLTFRLNATAGLAAFMGGTGFIRLNSLPDDSKISLWINVMSLMSVSFRLMIIKAKLLLPVRMVPIPSLDLLPGRMVPIPSLDLLPGPPLCGPTRGCLWTVSPTLGVTRLRLTHGSLGPSRGSFKRGGGWGGCRGSCAHMQQRNAAPWREAP